jgi:hypothetical protein
MKKEKNAYITPLLTVVEFRTERGYASSEGNLVINSSQAIQGFIDREVALEEHQMGEVREGGVLAGEMLGNEDHSNAGSGSAWQYSDGGWF